MRYRVQVLGWALIWSGVFVFGYIGWQLYVTDWLNAEVQAEAAEGLAVTMGSDVEPETVDTDDLFGDDRPDDLPEVVSRFHEEPVALGEPFAFLTISAIGIEDLVVYEGVDRQTLASGPGHMPTTPLPGQPGNAALSGHRTTHGRPFFDFDRLALGDRVEVETSIGTHVYEIREFAVVLPTDVWVVDPRPGGWLTMTTCEPKFSARQRLVVWAEMVGGPNHDFIEVSASLDESADG
jgi:sortase A